MQSQDENICIKVVSARRHHLYTYILIYINIYIYVDVSANKIIPNNELVATISFSNYNIITYDINNNGPEIDR